MERRAFLKGAAGVVTGFLAANAKAADAEKKAEAGWTPLFNGKDLTGWSPFNHAKWSVENGCIVGVQGPNGAAGDLFTDKDYADFELKVVYKIQWPANSGVWFRYQSPEKAYQADILEFKNPEAYSGTLYCPAKMFLGINKDKNLEKKDDWNTYIIKCKGDHIVLELNGKTTVDVHDSLYAKGKIGFQVHPGDEFKNMKVTVKEVSIKQL